MYRAFESRDESATVAYARRCMYLCLAARGAVRHRRRQDDL